MPTTILQHCVPVTVYSSDVPSDVRIDLTAGGATGDGAVQLLPNPGPMDPAGPLGTGLSVVFSTLGCTRLELHYVRAPGGPLAIPVTYTLTVS